MYTRRHRSTLLFAAVLALSVGCASDDAENPIRVGEVFDSEALVAIVFDDTRLLAYVCDGHTTAEWLRGPLVGFGFDLLNDDGSRIKGEILGEMLRGELWFPDGRHRDFVTQPAHGEEGLYYGEGIVDGQTWIGGWILRPDDDRRGTVRSVDGRERLVSLEFVPEEGTFEMEVTHPDTGDPLGTFEVRRIETAAARIAVQD